MTHDELLEQIQKDINEKAFIMDEYYPVKMLFALRAVVELHKPSGIFCRGCGFNEEYNEPSQLLPCPTIQAIEKELHG
jgi:hypothetical protein